MHENCFAIIETAFCESQSAHVLSAIHVIFLLLFRLKVDLMFRVQPVLSIWVVTVVWGVARGK